MPASIRYSGLFRSLGDRGPLVAHEMTLYLSRPNVPDGYSIEQEVEALDRATRSAGHEQFHLYGHSGGGAIALAYAWAHPDRLRSLALDEPSTDFTEDDLNSEYWDQIRRLRDLPEDEQIPAFRVLQVEPGFTPPPIHDPRPLWMSGGPTRIAAFRDAVVAHRMPAERAFLGPVYYSYGSRTHPRYDQIRRRLAARFADFHDERYEGLHHLSSGHQVHPDRVASVLQDLWQHADATRVLHT